jgi:signal transduction histidine kinase
VKLPRPTLRVRLTALYAGLFGLSTAGLLVVSYWLLERHLDRVLPGPDARDAMSDVAAQYLWAFAGTVLLAVAIGWVVAGRALDPLQRMTQAARRVSEERLDERIPVPGPRDELRELSETLNAMLDRLAGSFDAQQRFVANASHELRSPLTVMRSEAEVALANPDPDVDELRRAAEAVVEASGRTEALLEGLMILARSQRGLVAREPVDLADAARAAERTWADEARAADVQVRLRSSPVSVTGDRALLERLIANLAQNAVRHNRAGGWATVAVGVDGSAAVVRVENSGRVIEPDAARRLAEPFQRLDRASDVPGAGLGLSIVSAVAEAHGGTLSIAPRPDGGLAVEVRLPTVSGLSGGEAARARGSRAR